MRYAVFSVNSFVMALIRCPSLDTERTPVPEWNVGYIMLRYLFSCWFLRIFERLGDPRLLLILTSRLNDLVLAFVVLFDLLLQFGIIGNLGLERTYRKVMPQ